jgi:hypothetical protein
MQLMLQAAIGDCLALDPFAFEEDGLSASEVEDRLASKMTSGQVAEARRLARGWKPTK